MFTVDILKHTKILKSKITVRITTINILVHIHPAFLGSCGEGVGLEVWAYFCRWANLRSNLI